MTVAIIIARGGSRRIPRKNARDFCGKPLVCWTIEQALRSKLIDEVLVTTDDDEIEEISKWAGAKTYHRPPDPEGASGTYPTMMAIKAIREQKVEGIHSIDHVVSLLPTSPVRHDGDIDRMIRKYFSHKLRDRTIEGTAALCKKLETIVYKPMEDGSVETVIWAKHNEYLTCGGGMGITDADAYLRNAKKQPLTDAEADIGPDILKYHIGARSYIELEPYQTAELDEPDQWGVAEAIMRYYILEGKDGTES